MEIHLFEKNKSDAPVHLGVQKYATSRSNVMNASYANRTAESVLTRVDEAQMNGVTRGCHIAVRCDVAIRKSWSAQGRYEHPAIIGIPHLKLGHDVRSIGI